MFNRTKIDLISIADIPMYIRGCLNYIVFYILNNKLIKPNYNILLGILFVIKTKLIFKYTSSLLKANLLFKSA